MLPYPLYVSVNHHHSRLPQAGHISIQKGLIMKNNKTKNLVLCAMCAAITCILAPISIPIEPVPISLCTFAVMLAGVLLGAKLGFVSQLVYVLLGAVGLPVFSGYSAGFSCIAGMTGGYIVAYPILAFITGLLYWKFGRDKSGKVRALWKFLGMLIGTIVLYAFGTVWFCVVSGTGFMPALGMCVLPFLPGDFLKMIIVILLSAPIENALRKTEA